MIGLLLAGCEDPDTTAYDPVGVAADEAGFMLLDVPLDQIASCVESTKYNAFMGDADAQERWDAAGQSETALTHACTEIGRHDPEDLAAMHWEWTVAKSSADGAPTPD